MNRKDDLLRLAFGELNDDAASAVEAQASDAERAEVAAFRRLREDLHQLPPPPPDNLTAERLRAAILDRELKTRRPFNWGSLLVAPLAFAAVAMVVVLPRLRLRPEPQIVSRNEVNLQDSVATAAPKFDEFRPFHSTIAAREMGQSRSRTQAQATKTLAKANSEEDGAFSPKAHRHHPRSRRVLPDEPEKTPFDNQDFVALNSPMWDSVESQPSERVPIHEPQTIAAPTSAVVKAEPGELGKTETVVIVSTKRDLETGALAATEQEASSVLVGG